MSHQKKENRDRKRKQPIPSMCIHPTKKQIEAKRNAKRKWSIVDIDHF